MGAKKRNFAVLVVAFLFLNGVMDVVALADKTHPCADKIADMRRISQGYAREAQEYKRLNPEVEEDDTDYMSISVPANCYNECADQMENPNPAFVGKTKFCNLIRTITYYYPDGRKEGRTETTTLTLFTLKCDCLQEEQQEQVMPAEQQDAPQEVEALVEKAPAPEDFSPGPSEEDLIPEELRKRYIPVFYFPATAFVEHPLDIIAFHVVGQPELHLPDGRVVVIREGDRFKFPLGSKIITGPRTRIQVSGFLLLEQSSQIEFKAWLPPTASPNLAPLGTVEIQKGYGRFREGGTVLRKVSETSVGILTRGTDFAIAFDPIIQLTVVELYDGEIDVTSPDGETTKTLKTSYGNPIKRVEVAKDGAMTEQIAIPKDEWRARQMEQPQAQTSSNFLWILFVFLLAGAVYFAYRKKEKIISMFLCRKRR